VKDSANIKYGFNISNNTAPARSVYGQKKQKQKTLNGTARTKILDMESRRKYKGDLSIQNFSPTSNPTSSGRSELRNFKIDNKSQIL